MASDKQTPEIRFLDFSDNWKERKLGEYVQIISGNAPSEFSEGNVNYVKVDDLNNAYKTIFETKSKVDKHSTVEKVKKGSIIFPKRGAAILTNKVRILGVDSYMDTNMMALTTERLHSEFLYVLISKEGLYKIADTSTIPQINNKHIEPYKIMIPGLSEQDKIGKLFDHLDNLISLHQKKHTQLITIKKAMLEKMFPKEGETVPEIRFAGFSTPWQKKSFSDITFPSGIKNHDNLPLESYSITNEYGFIPQNEKFENGGTMRDADKRMYYIVSPNSFAYNPARINVGSIGYQNIGKDVIVSSLYEIFKTTSDVDDRFLWHWFKSNDFQKLIFQLQEGGVRLYFYYDKLRMGSLALPELREQYLIGKYLDGLDDLITLQQKKIDKLQHIKKAFLDKMFV